MPKKIEITNFHLLETPLREGKHLFLLTSDQLQLNYLVDLDGTVSHNQPFDGKLVSVYRTRSFTSFACTSLARASPLQDTVSAPGPLAGSTTIDFVAPVFGPPGAKQMTTTKWDNAASSQPEGSQRIASLQADFNSFRLVLLTFEKKRENINGKRCNTKFKTSH